MEESIDVKIFPFFVFQIIKEKKALLPHSWELLFLFKDTAIQFYQKDTLNTNGSFVYMCNNSQKITDSLLHNTKAKSHQFLQTRRYQTFWSQDS